MSSPVVVAQYLHPQGKRIDLLDNDGIVCTKNGKKATTSATADKLRAGHGGWVRVHGGSSPAATAASIAAPLSVATPKTTLTPMKFQETPVGTVRDFSRDPRWVFQQKVDGIRAQLVVDPSETPWFRNGRGGALVSAVAAPTVAAVLAEIPAVDPGQPGYTVDGEILNGTFYAFDLVVEGGERTLLADRLVNLTGWHKIMQDNGYASNIAVLPTAHTETAKTDLWDTIKSQGAEGVIAKRLDGTYDWGQRVTHSLKLKITHTLDVVVVGRNVGADCNAVLALHDATGTQIKVGTVSCIGHNEVKVGDVVEVKTLYAGSGGKLVQPSILRVRADREPESCLTAQMKFADKRIVDLSSV